MRLGVWGGGHLERRRRAEGEVGSRVRARMWNGEKLVVLAVVGGQAGEEGVDDGAALFAGGAGYEEGFWLEALLVCWLVMMAGESLPVELVLLG